MPITARNPFHEGIADCYFRYELRPPIFDESFFEP